MNRRNLPLILLVLLTVLFAVGVFELFELRFESGDVYPPYSSMRTDPLGASAFYESLGMLPGISVRRDMSDTGKLPDGPGTAYLHLSGNSYEWRDMDEETVREIETFVRSGGRLVVALYPEPVKPRFAGFGKKKDEEKKNDEKDPEKPGQKPEDKEPAKADPKKAQPAKGKGKRNSARDKMLHIVSVEERWGIGFDIRDMNQGEHGSYEPLLVDRKADEAVPASVMWHSGGILTNLDKAWKVVYVRGKDAVLAERRMGAGTLVFSTDSFFLSNEAMQKGPEAGLLAWLVGPSRRVIFDEAHLGIADRPGIAALLRQYRLHGFVAGLLVLAALFIWKNATGFGPAREDDQPEGVVAGKDAAAGFVNLLRHHIKSGDVLNTCVSEWRKSLPPGKFSAARIERVQALINQENALPPRERNPVRTYQAICHLLKQGPELPVPNNQSQTQTTSPSPST